MRYITLLLALLLPLSVFAADKPKTDKERLSYTIGTNMANSLMSDPNLKIDINQLNQGLKDALSNKVSEKKLSYAIGLMSGRNLARDPVLNLDAKQLTAAIEDIFKGNTSKMTTEEMTQVMQALQQQQQAMQQQMQAKMQQEMQAMGEKNRAAGDAFLSKNRKVKGVKETASGLQYKVLKQGSGKKPGLNDTVVAHYRGTLISGEEFDSSYKRGQPTEFPLTGVIKGWTEALQLMPVGSKYQLYIPSDLAYGSQGNPRIPPNSTLIFDVELVGIK